jgi:hypothetical protein
VETDLTDIANALPGKHTLRVVIPTWSDGAGKVSGSNGGWSVTASMKVRSGKPPRSVLAVLPLVNRVHLPATVAQDVAYQVPVGAKSMRFEYLATGHGAGAGDAACIGPAEEFCKRTHTLLLDGAAIESQLLWRTDCDQLCTVSQYAFPGSAPFDYCKENPCGAMGSVRAPRANWCPGSVTSPFTLTLLSPAPGAHTFRYGIDKVAAGGSWRISSQLIIYGE